MAAIVAGVVMLTIFKWAGPSHTYMNSNWIEVLATPLGVSAIALVTGGLASVIWAIARSLALLPVQWREGPALMDKSVKGWTIG
jgi:ABC-type sulfate transport system permease component